MFGVKMRHGKFKLWLILLAVLLVFSNSLAIAGGGGAQSSGQEAAHGSGGEGVHGADRSADLLDLLYRFINFALLVIILFIAVKKSGLKDFLTGRIKEIKQRLEDLQREKGEAEDKYDDIVRALKEFEAKRKQIIEQFRKEGEEEKGKIIAQAEERARQILEQAELTIQHEMESAKDRLKREVMDLAAQKAQEIIVNEMTEEDQDRLVDEFIERVGKVH